MRQGQTLRPISSIKLPAKWRADTNLSTHGYHARMTPAPVKPATSLGILNQIDIRVGTIRAVADVPGSDELVQLRVSFGDHERTIVAGLKRERENPREIEGKQALFVLNLEPRKMRGMVSEGMLFDIGYADGVRPVLAVPEAPIPDGTRAG
jgi:tRNA-binding protein